MNHRKSPPGNRSDWETLRDMDRFLLKAIDQKDFEKADKLIRKGADVNVKFGEIKDSALHFFDDIEAVMKLINCGANILTSNRYQESPLIYAVKYCRHKDIIKSLLINGAYVNKRIGKTIIPLSYAMENLEAGVDVETIEDLLFHGANMDFGKMFTKSPFISGLNHSSKMAKIFIKYSSLRIWDKYRFPKMGHTERRLLTSINNKEYLPYLEECISEISLLKEEKFNSRHSLYDICRGNIYYCFDTQPYQSFVMYKTEKFQSKYPIYFDVFLKRADAILTKRSKILRKLDSLRVCSKYTSPKLNTRLVALNTDCLRHIAKFLADNDIERVIRAAK